MFADELHAMFAYYARAGFPRPPDVPRGFSLGGPNWSLALDPREAARLDRAVELGARGAWSWTERDNNL